MKIRILTATALIDQEHAQTAGMYEEVDAPDARAEYLISIGAAEEVKAAKKPTKRAETAPEKDDAPEGPKDAAKPAQRRPQPRAGK